MGHVLINKNNQEPINTSIIGDWDNDSDHKAIEVTRSTTKQMLNPVSAASLRSKLKWDDAAFLNRYYKSLERKFNLMSRLELKGYRRDITNQITECLINMQHAMRESVRETEITKTKRGKFLKKNKWRSD